MTGFRRIVRAPAGRITNQTLFVALVLVFGTGVATVAIGSSSGRWAAIAHGIAGLVILLLVPWKSRVARGGLRRGRPTRWVSLLLAALVVITFVAGVGYATGLVRSIAGRPGLWVHIAVALAGVPLVLWHLVARRIRPRRSDLSRRTFLRAGLLGAGAAGLYFAAAGAVRLGGLPGATRRFTGSYQTESFDPDAMPVTSWLVDPVPAVDPDRWRLTVVDGDGRYQLGLDELAARRPAAGDAGLHLGLVRPAGLERRAGQGPAGQHRAGPEPARALGHRVLDPAAGERRRPAAAGHPRRRRSPVRGPRVPAAPGRAGPPGVLVGEVGRPHRASGDALVVAAAVPGDLRPGCAEGTAPASGAPRSPAVNPYWSATSAPGGGVVCGRTSGT